MSKVMKIILIVLLVVVLAVVGVGMYVLSSMRSDAVQTVAKPTEDLTMTTEEPATIQVVSEEPTPSPTPMPIYEEEALDDNIVNILLIGTDSRSADESENSEGRSDSMILASLNKETGKIALVSFMRDARVHRIGESGNINVVGIGLHQRVAARRRFARQLDRPQFRRRSLRLRRTFRHGVYPASFAKPHSVTAGRPVAWQAGFALYMGVPRPYMRPPLPHGDFQ